MGGNWVECDGIELWWMGIELDLIGWNIINLIEMEWDWIEREGIG